MSNQEDAAAMLADFVSSLDNLPSEIHHILQEIGHKEGKASEARHRAGSRDQSIQKHARPHAQGGMGLLVVNPKEEVGITKIRVDYEKAEALARDKVALSERGVNLLSRHLGRLTAQLELLTSNVPPLPTLPSFAPPAAPAQPSSHYSTQVYTTPVAPPQYHNAYSAGSFGMGTGSTGLATPTNPAPYQGYGTPTDQKRKSAPQSTPPPMQAPQYPAQMQQNPAHHPHPNTAYAYPSAAAGAAAASRGPRPSRLSNVYPTIQGQHPQANMGHPQQQQQQQQMQQQQHMQQMQQQMHRQQQAQSQQQQAPPPHSNHHPGHSVQKRRRHDDGEAEDDDGGEEGADGEDLTPYCFCQRASFGEMIGCDAPNCAVEWFHLSCVGLKTTPEGSWYCSVCEPKMKAGGGGGRRRK